jgi:hypothetical protein
MMRSYARTAATALLNQAHKVPNEIWAELALVTPVGVILITVASKFVW